MTEREANAAEVASPHRLYAVISLVLLIMTLVLLAMGSAAFIAVAYRFKMMFEEMDIELPWITKIPLALNSWPCAILVVALVAALVAKESVAAKKLTTAINAAALCIVWTVGLLMLWSLVLPLIKLMNSIGG
jgi:hypothetical protein